MFTGIIQAVGKIASIEQKGVDSQVRIDTGRLDMSNVNTGDSIAVSGICLTVVEHSTSGFSADVSGETLSRTTLVAFRPSDAVNLEKALTLGTPLGGHLVSGHVDGVGTVLSREPEGRSVQFRFQAPDVLARYIAEKGSICVDGVSLTVNAVNGAKFDVNIVPHTLTETTLDNLRPGSKVNLEVDLLARYLERLMLGEGAAQDSSGITHDFLARHGYIK
ncbi:MAG: riboflavin synthase [Sulfuricaulis sp.]|uniref:riboflavin synthase n=1 Tax=Sulfuricaulis sp. TaxID=2003553 RepID=UPI0025E67413|nr:riboflavin synthase [Sulfuricaulis sp.]MCR4345622.1 riboflavin synthase [Sulfuricaulis sp.]